MYVLEFILESNMEYALQHVLKLVLLEKILKKNHGLLKVGMMKIPGDHATLSIVRHVRLHIDFSSTKSSLDL